MARRICARGDGGARGPTTRGVGSDEASSPAAPITTARALGDRFANGRPGLVRAGRGGARRRAVHGPGAVADARPQRRGPRPRKSPAVRRGARADRVFVSYPPVRAEASHGTDVTRSSVARRPGEPGAGVASRGRTTRSGIPRAHFRLGARTRRGSPWTRWSGGGVSGSASCCETSGGQLRRRPGVHGAWRDRFDDGWRYRATIQAEWATGRYANGFDWPSRRRRRSFPLRVISHIGSYDRSFEAWSAPLTRDPDGSSQDGDDDGVFEPGACARRRRGRKLRRRRGRLGRDRVGKRRVRAGNGCRPVPRARPADRSRASKCASSAMSPRTRAPVQIAIAGRITDASRVSRPLVFEEAESTPIGSADA